eukprot:1156458-Pelagomonas_calceolata.AAC.8
MIWGREQWQTALAACMLVPGPKWAVRKGVHRCIRKSASMGVNQARRMGWEVEVAPCVALLSTPCGCTAACWQDRHIMSNYEAYAQYSNCKEKARGARGHNVGHFL